MSAALSMESTNVWLFTDTGWNRPMCYKSGRCSNTGIDPCVIRVDAALTLESSPGNHPMSHKVGDTLAVIGFDPCFMLYRVGAALTLEWTHIEWVLL